MNLFKDLPYTTTAREHEELHLAVQANIREWHFSSRKVLRWERFSKQLKRQHAKFRALDLVLDLDLELFLLISIQVFYYIRSIIGRS